MRIANQPTLPIGFSMIRIHRFQPESLTMVNTNNNTYKVKLEHLMDEHG